MTVVWVPYDFRCLFQSGRQFFGLFALSKRKTDFQGVNKSVVWAKGTGSPGSESTLVLRSARDWPVGEIDESC